MRFRIRDALGFGWEVTQEHLGFLVGVEVAYIGVQVLLRVALQVLGVPPLVSRPVSPLFHAVLYMGFLTIALGFVDGRRGTIWDLFSRWRLLGKYLGATVLTTLPPLAALGGLVAVVFTWRVAGLPAPRTVILAGALLFAAFAVAWGVAFRFAIYSVIDREHGPLAAMRASFTITRGERWHLFVFLLACAGMNLLGALVFVVGLLATIPATVIATAWVYRRLLGAPEDVITSAPAEDDFAIPPPIPPERR